MLTWEILSVTLTPVSNYDFSNKPVFKKIETWDVFEITV
jgi:hypothetical protein